MEEPDNLLDLLKYLPTVPAPSVEQSPTSTARAIREDSNGTTTRRQRDVLHALARAGVCGLTWRELADELGLHHGQASGALSSLHRAGAVFALRVQRNNCQPYVHGSLRASFHESDRADTPVTTKSGRKRALLEALADSVRLYLHYPTDGNFLRMKQAMSDVEAE